MAESIILKKAEDFAVGIVNLHKELTKKKKEFQIADQIKRSGTAIGALVCEAIYAESCADFVHKLKIALKESHETAYWLRVLHRTEYLAEEEFKKLTEKNEEIKRMLIASVKTKLADKQIKEKR